MLKCFLALLSGLGFWLTLSTLEQSSLIEKMVKSKQSLEFS